MELKIGTTLRALLKERRLTLKEVSKNCGVALSTLHEWENNRAPRNPVQAARVAKFLNVSLSKLLFGEDDEQSLSPIEKILKEDIFKGTFEITLKRVKLPSEEKE